MAFIWKRIDIAKRHIWMQGDALNFADELARGKPPYLNSDAPYREYVFLRDVLSILLGIKCRADNFDTPEPLCVSPR